MGSSNDVYHLVPVEVRRVGHFACVDGVVGVMDVVCMIVQLETDPELVAHPSMTYKALKASTMMLCFVDALSSCTVMVRGTFLCSTKTVLMAVIRLSHAWHPPATTTPGDRIT